MNPVKSGNQLAGLFATLSIVVLAIVFLVATLGAHPAVLFVFSIPGPTFGVLALVNARRASTAGYDGPIFTAISWIVLTISSLWFGFIFGLFAALAWNLPAILIIIGVPTAIIVTAARMKPTTTPTFGEG